MIRRLLPIFVFLAVSSMVFAADQPSITTMVMGNEAVTLADNYQLTRNADGKVVSSAISPDGKRVAFISDNGDSMRLCLVDTAGGKPTILLNSSNNPKSINVYEGRSIWILKSSDIVWSPDEKLIAITADKVTKDSDGVKQKENILALTPDGKEKASIAVPDGRISGFMSRFSPDSSKLMAVIGGINDPSVWFIVHNFSDNKDKALETKTFTDQGRWTDDGKAIQYWSLAANGDKSEFQLREVSIDNNADKTIGKAAVRRAYLSTDGNIRVMSSDTGLVVEKMDGSAIGTPVTGEWPRYTAWSPDSKMLLYQLSFNIPDQNKIREMDNMSLWLANLDNNKLNTMCISLDSDPLVAPTWSADNSKIAYVNKGSLFVAELAKRALTPEEKLAVGVKLSEEEEKTVLLKNAQEISDVIGQFALDQNRLPNSMDELYKYAGKDIFQRPGTDKVIFEYKAAPGAALASITKNTLFGVLDAGYGWQIMVYPVQRVETVKK